MRWQVTTLGATRPLVVLLKGAPAGVGVFVTVLALLVASAALGARLPAFGFLHRLPALHDLDYGADAIGRLPQLSREFLLEALGGPTLSRLVGDPVIERRAVRRPAAAPSSPQESPPPGPGRGALPGVVGGDWELRPRMEADRDTVPAEGEVRYRVIVGNIGTEPFRGDFVITSHIPFGTRDASPSPCGEPGVSPDPEHPCVQPSAPVPGSPSEDVHQVTFSVGFTGDGLAPGEDYVASFRVRVNAGVPSGTRIVNHAHLDVVGDSDGPVTTDEVVVTVE